VQQTIIDDVVDQYRESLHCCMRANSRRFKHFAVTFLLRLMTINLTVLGLTNIWFLFTFYCCVVLDLFALKAYKIFRVLLLCNIQTSINQFIEQKDQSATYTDCMKYMSQFKIHMYIKYKTHYTVYTQDNQLNKKYIAVWE